MIYNVREKRDSMNVLVIAPHADDEVLGVGGTIQWHAKRGDAVYVCVVANRVLEHKVIAEYIRQTKQSSMKVKKLLGIKDYFFCDLMDEHLDESLIKVIVAIEEVINTATPDIVYIPNENDSNQDHRAVCQACQVACRNVDRILVYEVLTPSTVHFIPNLYIELTESFLNNKIKALACYEGEIRAYPNRRSKEGIRVFAQMRGMDCNKKLAEAFILSKEVLQ